ncbi:unnamed protein product [Clavelina lepadiformis]|uniref:Polypeptide N-acetylgalactosaminyltransferase n=1 Tax=Clavelina lepadiformis TaxID=159417 RepID=A0ABP0FWH4_CLALP
MRIKPVLWLKVILVLLILSCGYMMFSRMTGKKAHIKADDDYNNLMPEVNRDPLIPDHGADNNEFPVIDGVEVNLKDSKHHLAQKMDKPVEFGEQDVGNHPKDDVAYPILNWRRLGNYEDVSFPKRVGPGEYGAKVVAQPSEKDAVSASIKEFGFNMVNSDKISLDRLPKDLRHQECRHWDYSQNLPKVSVIIVFHNEGWSTLVRTVHSVINLTPKELLAEIVMIDDHSSKEHLGQRLANYIEQFKGLVKLYRNERREGLIRARSIGAQKSMSIPGIILIYLDAHCEVGFNWLPPLIMPIVNNRMVTTVPLIDVISGQDYTFTPQAGGDSDGFARGAWDWSMLWKRVPLTREEKDRRKHTTDPYRSCWNFKRTLALSYVCIYSSANETHRSTTHRVINKREKWSLRHANTQYVLPIAVRQFFRSPAMAGGLFAIERAYFFEIGLYDPGLEIWGGENFELSFKIWMCGGEVLFVPCSRVGHVYRLPGWSGNPPPEYIPANPSLRNYIRVVETWWDEYKDYFYASRPETINMPYGDVSKQVAYRTSHNCKSFKWFMENIAYDITDHYPLPPRNKEWGEIRALDTNQCLDSMGHKNGEGPLETGYCHRMGGNQLFRLSEANQLAQYDQCVTIQRSIVTVMHCDISQYKEWNHRHEDHSIRHITTGKCLERGELVHNVFLATCDPTQATQKWEINKVQST